jgi:hypothetical protein
MTFQEEIWVWSKANDIEAVTVDQRRIKAVVL